MNDEKRKKSTTTDSQPPAPGHEHGPAPQPVDERTGQHKAYWILSEEERGKGFVRPVRRSYKHGVCGTVTHMGQAIAETYARDPSYYGATFCVECRGHFPVGAAGDFVWIDDGTKVGT